MTGRSNQGGHQWADSSTASPPFESLHARLGSVRRQHSMRRLFLCSRRAVLIGVMPWPFLMGLSACGNSNDIPAAELDSGQRLVELRGINCIEEGNLENGMRIGTWRYLNLVTKAVMEEIDYRGGQELRHRIWVVQPVIYEYEQDGGTWIGFARSEGKEGSWVHWTLDLKLDCVGSGIYHFDKRIEDVHVLPGGAVDEHDPRTAVELERIKRDMPYMIDPNKTHN